MPEFKGFYDQKKFGEFCKARKFYASQRTNLISILLSR